MNKKAHLQTNKASLLVLSLPSLYCPFDSLLSIHMCGSILKKKNYWSIVALKRRDSVGGGLVKKKRSSYNRLLIL